MGGRERVRERHWVIIMCRHTASICAGELAVCRAYCCVTCRESECMRACVRASERSAGAYCDLIWRVVCEGPLVFARSCLSAASLIMSLAALLMQQLIAAPSATARGAALYRAAPLTRVTAASAPRFSHILHLLFLSL